MNYLNRRDNPALFWMSKIGDFCALSVLWILLCLPVVTFVPACVALYDTVAHCLHGSEDGPVQHFFRTFKSELGRGILLSFVWLIIGFVFISGFNILFQMSQEDQALGPYALVYLFSMLIPLSILAWVIPIQSRFEHSFFGVFRSSAVYAIAHLPTTIMLLVIFVLTVFAIYMLAVLALILPAIAVTIQCWFIERVFKNYIPQEDENDE